jgi:Histidine kinase-, DNA gyrase B-, and HSP90-like ATPase
MSVKIGKNVIEILTTGMYTNPLFMFREYVQNSADQIDTAVEAGLFESRNEGEIHITIDERGRTVEIEDNATGVKAEEAWVTLTSIAASEKDRKKKKGFRGIGRLGGLAYCDELIFETTACGEKTKSILKWDSKDLRQILSDQTIRKDAHEVVADITEFSQEHSENIDSHYFRVKLIGVSNNEILDVADVRHYLAMVSPVPIVNKFLFRSQIYEKFKEKNISIDEYRIYVNTEEILKPYSTKIYTQSNGSKNVSDEILDVKFIELKEGNELIAIGWYGISSAQKQMPPCNIARGIRLRKGNIQIGEDDTLQRLWKERRFHFYFIGELHAINAELVPNGRRDYFDENKTLKVFEAELQAFLNNELHRLTHAASTINSAKRKLDKLDELEKEFEEKSTSAGFVSPKEHEELQKKIERGQDDAEKARKDLGKIREKAQSNPALEKIYERVVGVEPQNKKKPEKNGNGKPIWQTDKLSKLTKKERKIVSEIYEVVRNVLTPDLAQNLILKIEEKFK